MVQGAQVTDGRFKADPMAVLQTVTNNPLLTREEVGKIHGITHGRVSQICSKYGIDKDELADFKDNRADIFANLQRVITESLTVDEIKKAPAASRVLMMCQIYDKERLERGQSTENVLNVNVIKALDAKAADLRNALNDLMAVDNSGNQPIVRDNVIEHEPVEQIHQLNQPTSDNNDYVNLRDSVTGHDKAEPVASRRGRKPKGR